jgi:hypothetical protein
MKAKAILALAAFASATACAAAGKPFWLKNWSFGEVVGSAEAKAALAKTGANHLALQSDKVTDPLSEGCAKDVSYADIKHRSKADMARHFGPFWRFPPTLDTPRSVAGWVRCNGHNVAPVAFVNSQLGYRFFEDGIVITLH